MSAMRRASVQGRAKPVFACLVSGALAGFVPMGSAQDRVQNDSTRAQDKALPECPPGVTNPLNACKTAVRSEGALSISVDLPAGKATQCTASVAFEYSQRNTVARVQSTVENSDCAASAGEYTLVLRVRGEDGEVRTLGFPEHWRRDDDRSVTLSRDYPIGENVDLVGVRTSGIRCSCADAAAVAAAPAAESPAEPR